ncbi:MAG: hypothetical protein SGARI_006415 [Bacillariaceae sp.]
MASSAAHSDVTLALAKKEQGEHLAEILSPEIIEAMEAKPLMVKAYALNDPVAPSIDNSNVKIAHFSGRM